MNIKQHIESGHYPKDSKGRALVPHEYGMTATILATDGPRGFPIVAMGDGIGTNGVGYFVEDTTFLLPPPPRKVEVKAYMVVGREGCVVALHRFDPNVSSDLAACYPNDRVVELTGSYEEPWS